MKIMEKKRPLLSTLALVFCIISFFIASIEIIMIGMETIIEDLGVLFFTSPGDPVFVTSLLDHIMKAFINFIIGGIFLNGYLKIRKGAFEGFSFLIGGGFLTLGLGFLFISTWFTNLIDTAIIGIIEPEVWDEFVIMDGIRIEWFLGIASIYIVIIWKNRENYLKS
ncbi:MAG: hypothetical protein ACTSUN_11430 [Promethearchaeota archaeon]